MQWIFAYAAISAAWHFEDDSDLRLAVDIAKIGCTSYKDAKV